MDIEILREEKQKMEIAIADAIKRFHDATNEHPASVDIYIERLTPMGSGKQQFGITKVTSEVEL